MKTGYSTTALIFICCIAPYACLAQPFPTDTLLMVIAEFTPQDLFHGKPRRLVEESFSTGTNLPLHSAFRVRRVIDFSDNMLPQHETLFWGTGTSAVEVSYSEITGIESPWQYQKIEYLPQGLTNQIHSYTYQPSAHSIEEHITYRKGPSKDAMIGNRDMTQSRTVSLPLPSLVVHMLDSRGLLVSSKAYTQERKPLSAVSYLRDDSGRIRTVKKQESKWSTDVTQYSYNDHGQIAYALTREVFAPGVTSPGGLEATTRTYEYGAIDDHSNWMSRQETRISGLQGQTATAGSVYTTDSTTRAYDYGANQTNEGLQPPGGAYVLPGAGKTPAHP